MAKGKSPLNFRPSGHFFRKIGTMGSETKNSGQRVITSEYFEDFKCRRVHFGARVPPKVQF